MENYTKNIKTEKDKRGRSCRLSNIKCVEKGRKKRPPNEEYKRRDTTDKYCTQADHA